MDKTCFLAPAFGLAQAALAQDVRVKIIDPKTGALTDDAVAVIAAVNCAYGIQRGDGRCGRSEGGPWLCTDGL
jgi:hypothetical protein